MSSLRQLHLTGSAAPGATSDLITDLITEADRRAVGRWAADCAERALPIFEGRAPADGRPRAAIEGIRAFSRGELRAGQVRSLALAAHAAARSVADPAAAAAARAAGAAAAVAMIHRTAATLGTAEHAFGPAAYAALAKERAASPGGRVTVEGSVAADGRVAAEGRGADGGGAAAEVTWAVRSASPDVRAIARRVPRARAARGRLAEFIAEIHAGLDGPAPR